MDGINYFLGTYSINPKDGASQAIKALNSLTLSTNTIKHFIKECIDIPENAKIDLPEGHARAKATLAHILQIGIKTSRNKFSVDAYNELKARAYSTAPEDAEYVPVGAAEVIQPPPKPAIPAPVAAPATFQVAHSTTVVVRDKPMLPSVTVKPPAIPEIANVEKGKRGRKADPNSNLAVAKRLYAEAADKTRDVIVELFKEKLGLNHGTATTYYYLARKP